MPQGKKKGESMAKVIIFDVDGTLLDTERVYMDAWRQAGPLFRI